MKRTERSVVGRRLTVAAWVMVICFALSLVPILWASFYAHPFLDDYNYGLYTHEAIQAGGGLFGVLAAAAKKVAETYVRWQGTYSAVFLFSLMPGVFSENAYFLTTFIMVGALSASTFFLMDTLIVRWLGKRRSLAVVIAAAVLLMQMQFMPDKWQGLYWFNGASFYTVFYSLSLVLFALVIRILLKHGGAGIPSILLALLLALLIGGGNYVTALVSVEILFLSALCAWHAKNPAWKQVFIAFLAILTGLIVSAVAPGNAVRAARFDQMNPVKAVIKSIYMMTRNFGKWARLPQVIFIAAITPLIYPLSKACKWEFRKPLLVCCVAYLVYCSQITPPLYAMHGGGGAGRIYDIYFYGFHLLLIFCDFYICGWLARKELIGTEKLNEYVGKHLLCVCVVTAALFAASCLLFMWSLTSIEAGASLIRGEPQRFDREFEMVRERFVQAGGGRVEIPEIDAVPTIFGNAAPSGTMAVYYGAEPVEPVTADADEAGEDE